MLCSCVGNIHYRRERCLLLCRIKAFFCLQYNYYYYFYDIYYWYLLHCYYDAITSTALLHEPPPYFSDVLCLALEGTCTRGVCYVCLRWLQLLRTKYYIVCMSVSKNTSVSRQDRGVNIFVSPTRFNQPCFHRVCCFVLRSFIPDYHIPNCEYLLYSYLYVCMPFTALANNYPVDSIFCVLYYEYYAVYTM